MVGDRIIGAVRSKVQEQDSAGTDVGQEPPDDIFRRKVAPGPSVGDPVERIEIAARAVRPGDVVVAGFLGPSPDFGVLFPYGARQSGAIVRPVASWKREAVDASSPRTNSSVTPGSVTCRSSSS